MKTADLPAVPFDDPVQPPANGINGDHESFEAATPVKLPTEGQKNASPPGMFGRNLPAAEAKQAVDQGIAAAAKMASISTSRTLPVSLESESGVLGALLLDPADVFPKCERAKVTQFSFSDPQNAAIYRVVNDRVRRDEAIDASIIAEELRDAPEFKNANVFAKIVEITKEAPTTVHASYFIDRLRKHEIRRELIIAAAAASEEAYTSNDVEETTENLRRRIDFATQGPRGQELWPEPVNAADFCAKPPAIPAVLIDGILYTTGTMLISGPSKSHKTFSALDAAIAIASGEPWLGFRTTIAPVLYLNLELQDFATAERLSKIASARGHRPPKDLHVWNLRGKSVTLDQLSVRLPGMLKKTSAKVVCIDPHYKVSAVSDMEENSNDAQGKLLATMEGICAKEGAALILTHHFAKGDASAKNAIDRASGGGVFARWGDVMLTFTPHEQDDAMTVEMALRNFAPVEPFVVRWEYPRWQRDGTLRATDLKSARGARERHNPKSVLDALGDDFMGFAEWQRRTGLGDSTFKRKRQELLDCGAVEQVGQQYRRKRE